MRRRAILVCPVDSSEATWRSVSHAVDLARLRRAELHLVYLPAVGAARGIATSRRTAAGPIADYARAKRADLIVISRYYGAGRRWRRSPGVARTLGRSASCPVLVITQDGGPVPRKADAPFARVVCAIDFSEASSAALLAAIPFVPRSGGRLTLFHAVEPVPRRAVLSGGAALQVQRDYQARVAAKAERLRRLVPSRALNARQVEPAVVSGPPERGILRVADEIQADLIVMGLVRRSALDEVLAGSTSRVVVQRSTCPVLLVPGPAPAKKRRTPGAMKK